MLARLRISAKLSLVIHGGFMSVTFALRSCVTGEDFLNLSNMNARELLSLIGIPTEDELYGKHLAKDFEVLVRRAMMRVGLDAEKLGSETQEPGKARMVTCGRPEGYLRGKLFLLMGICQARISDLDEISWG